MSKSVPTRNEVEHALDVLQAAPRIFVKTVLETSQRSHDDFHEIAQTLDWASQAAWKKSREDV